LFSKSKEKENTTTDLSINQCTVIQTCRVGPKQKFQVRHDRILSIQRISEKVSDSEYVTFLPRNPQLQV